MKNQHKCQFCTEREVGCHATCKTYNEIKESNDKDREEQQKQKAVGFYRLHSNGTYYSGKNPRR